MLRLSFSVARAAPAMAGAGAAISPYLFFATLSRPVFRLSSSLTVAPASDAAETLQPIRRSVLLDRLRSRHLKDEAKPSPPRGPHPRPTPAPEKERRSAVVGSFEELGFGEEVMAAVTEMGISEPTEIQCIGVPAVLEGKSVVLGSHTGSGKTLAYLLPLVQLLRRDEELYGMLMKPKRPRAVVLCPTRELCEQVFRVAKSISHHARFRSTMISGGGRLRPQEDSLNMPVDMIVGTPGRILQHIEEGNMVYGDIKYLVLDEADTMFDRGFGPDIRKFLAPLKKRTAKPNDQGFQTVLVTATMTKAVQKLIDEEFEGIAHLRTSTLHKKVASARHDFIKLSGAENKLESLLQVLEPSLAKGDRVMIFCNTLNSSRAVDHFLGESQIFTVNYHGEVPAEERVENLKKFKSEDGDCPTLVCTDLAARGLDLDVDHVIMFDFPRNSIDYLHRTGRTARMGAKGKVTSLVSKKDLLLASRIEEAMKKNQSLESLNADNVRKDTTGTPQSISRGRNSKDVKVTNQKSRASVIPSKSFKVGRKLAQTSVPKSSAGASVKRSSPSKARKTINVSKPVKFSERTSRTASPKASKHSPSKKSSKNSDAPRTTSSKLTVVGFRGRSSSRKRESPRHN